VKEIERIRQRIEKENLTEVFVLATSVKSSKVLIDKLKHDTFQDLKLSYRPITNPDTSDGINYANGVVILWGRWFEDNRILNFVVKNRCFMEHIFNVSDY